MKKLIASSLMSLAVAASGVSATELQSLKNMERERARMIETFMDDRIAAESRHATLATQQNRLVDLERLVLRDDRLLGHKDRLVRSTFNDYELSFLVHASTEAETAPVDHWLSEVGLGTRSILATEIGRR